MKNIILMFLLGTTIMLSQTKTSVRDITLCYNKGEKVMILNILPKTMNTNDSDMDVKIEIYKGYAIKMNINGETSPVIKPYFEHTGYTTGDVSWEFSDVKLGEEYILIVSNVCDNKYITNQQTGSIIIK